MTRRAGLALAVLALVAFIAAVYAPVNDGVFVWDDHALVETNEVVQRGSLGEIFTRPYWTSSSLSDVRPSYYRPLTTLTLRADYAMAGVDARSFHVSNLLVHLLATLALALVAQRMGAGAIAALLAAAVWSLHPRTTEAVAWISGRGDLLAGLMAIVAMGLWPWYGATATPGDGDGDGGAATATHDRIRAGLAGLALLVGLLAKEVAIAGAVGIGVGTLVGARTRARKRGRDAWLGAGKRLGWVVVPLTAYAALRLLATRGHVTPNLTPLGVEARSATVLEAIGRYLTMLFDPWHPATSIGLVGDIDAGSVVLGGIVIAFFVALALRAAVRRSRAPEGTAGAIDPHLAALGALGATSVALVVHVVPIALAAGVAADRLMYLPLAALALALAVASSALRRSHQRALGVAAIALGASFVPITRARAADYTDELRFRVVAAEHAHPRNTSPKSGLANVLRAGAETKLACKLHLSVRRTLERSGRTKSQRYIRGLENLGGCYAALGWYEDAQHTYELIERLEPNHARVHMELGYLAVHRLDLALAEVELRRALALDPNLEPARATLGAIPGIRMRLAGFTTERAQLADPAGWARLLSSIGRIPDSTAAWAAIVLDPKVDDATAWQGLQHLLVNADIETARRAAEASIARRVFASEALQQRLAKRLRQQASIDALRPRIEALADGEREVRTK